MYRLSTLASNDTRWRWTAFVGNSGYPAGASAATQGVCTSATAGAVPLPAPAPGNTWYLSSFVGSVAGNNTALMLMDRYWQYGALNSNITTTQTVNMALPARAAGDYTGGHLVFLEYYGTNAAIISPVTISYTNEAGVAGRTATLPFTLPTGLSAQGHTFGPFQLQGSDQGLRSVESLTLGTASGVAGTQITLVIAKFITQINTTNTNTEARLGYADMALPNVGADPCLYTMFYSRSSSDAIGSFIYQLTFVQG